MNIIQYVSNLSAMWKIIVGLVGMCEIYLLYYVLSEEDFLQALATFLFINVAIGLFILFIYFLIITGQGLIAVMTQ